MADLKDYAAELFLGGFKKSGDRLDNERESREQRAKDIIPFGIKFLDDATSGIWKNDLVVIGAKSGVGKTELMVNISLHAARRGKRVHYFALEAEDAEIERRVKYRHVADLYWKDPKRPRLSGAPVKYRYWIENRFEFELGAYDDEANALAHRDMANVSTYYKDESGEEFTIDTFLAKMAKIRGDTDLVVIDHLNYFDKPDGRHSTDEVFRIMKNIRTTSLRMGVPVVLASQVRKQDRKDPRPLPDMEDIYGSSDVFKIATKVIMFGPNDHYTSLDNRTFETFMRAQKMRSDSSVGRIMGAVMFDVSKNAYSKSYRCARASRFDEEVVFLPHQQWPEWAKWEQPVDREGRLPLEEESDEHYDL